LSRLPISNTRKLTRLLREKGARTAASSPETTGRRRSLAKAKAFPGLKGMDLAKEVTVAQPYSWQQGSWTLEGELPPRKPLLTCHSTWWPTTTA
jgi:carbamoyl-phosphate synthase small subunit